MLNDLIADRGAMLQLEPAIIDHLRAWAAAHDSIRELWLFGSRAKGTAREDSDVDLALSLAPPAGDHDWALGAYVSLHRKWREELAAIVGRPISFGALNDGRSDDEKAGAMDAEVRGTGICLWARKCFP